MPVPGLSDFFGSNLEPPPGVETYGSDPQGLILLLNNIFRVAIYGGGLLAVINFAISGIQYIGSAGTREVAKKPSPRIWFWMLGLLLMPAPPVAPAVTGNG